MRKSVTRLGGFLSIAFYDIPYAMDCANVGRAISIVGENVYREFWTIGGGGVRRPLFTALVRNALCPPRGYFVCAALYLDHELGKR